MIRMSHYQYLLQQEQQRREEAERQLYFTSASLEDMRRQLLELQSAYQQQSALLDHERQQCAALVEQLNQQQQQHQQQAILAEKERQQKSSKQQQLLQRVSAEVRRFQAANDPNGDADAFSAVSIESLFSREIMTVSSEIPAPNKYPHVDWSLDYSMARLEDMMEAPESTRNTLFYTLLSFHVKRLEMLIVDNSCDELIKRVNNELRKNNHG